MKFYIDYFGCRCNQAESQEWALQLEKAGYQYTTNLAEADFAILNTCSVTQNAERDTLRYLNRAFHSTGQCQWYIIGCTVNRDGETLQQRFKNFIFIDNHGKAGLVERIKKTYPTSQKVIYHSAFKSRLFLKIQDGCNFRCSFCIVPSLRGKSKSFPIEEIIEKARYNLSLGYREIVLTGINLSSYGYDLFPRQTLLELMTRLHELSDLEVLRLSSLDPRFIKYPMIKEFSRMPKLADSFHLSIQSGSDSVLKAMKRGGKSVEIRKILQYFRHFFPDANLGADLLVGFPGEEEKDFQKTLALAEEGELNYLHVFPFSMRPGTHAENLSLLPIETVRHRIKKLKEINHKLKMNYRERMLGKIVEGILIEENPSYGLVVTKNYLSVRIPPQRGFKKRKMSVKIIRILNNNICEGRSA